MAFLSFLPFLGRIYLFFPWLGTVMVIWYWYQSANIYNCRMRFNIPGSWIKLFYCWLGIKDIFNVNIFLIWAGSTLFWNPTYLIPFFLLVEVSCLCSFLECLAFCVCHGWKENDEFTVYGPCQQIHPDDAFGQQMIRNLEVKTSYFLNFIYYELA